MQEKKTPENSGKSGVLVLTRIVRDYTEFDTGNTMLTHIFTQNQSE